MGPAPGCLNRVVGFPKPPDRGVNCVWLRPAGNHPPTTGGPPLQPAIISSLFVKETRGSGLTRSVNLLLEPRPSRTVGPTPEKTTTGWHTVQFGGSATVPVAPAGVPPTGSGRLVLPQTLRSGGRFPECTNHTKAEAVLKLSPFSNPHLSRAGASRSKSSPLSCFWCGSNRKKQVSSLEQRTLQKPTKRTKRRQRCPCSGVFFVTFVTFCGVGSTVFFVIFVTFCGVLRIPRMRTNSPLDTRNSQFSGGAGPASKLRLPQS